jgi:hypothetical protein
MHRRLIERLLGARDLGDETGDQALDLGRWQVVAGIAVRQAHIAANHEGAQTRLGEALCLCDAEPADHLHRGGLADPLEDGASHIAEIIVLDESRICAPRVGLKVDTDRVDAGLDRPKRDLACRRGGSLVRHQNLLKLIETSGALWKLDALTTTKDRRNRQ